MHPRALFAAGTFAAATAGVAAPPAGALDLAVEEVRLDNGLTLLLLEDHAAPVFTIMLWVPAGGRTEAPGKTGISHYLEHCYSLGSAKLAPREIDRLVQALGGQKNAFTTQDFTAYYESLPAAALERIIAVEADRLGALALPRDRLASELDVVREERRLRYENAPSGMLTEKLLATAFERHPYRNPVTGWPEDLAAMTREDAVAYYRRHYCPANVTYVLVGDFSRERAVALFREHMGALPAGERPRVLVPEEPPQVAERRAELRKASVGLPRLAMLWKVPGLDHPDTSALAVLQTILFEGDAGRLERILKRDRRLATSVRGGHWENRDPGPFTLEVEALEGVAIDDLERACDEALDAVRTDGVTGAEVARARNQIEVGFLKDLEATAARARAIGMYHTSSARGWRYLADYCERVRAVAAEDVRRVAVRYFTRANRTVVRLLPEGGGPVAAAGATAAPAADLPLGEPFGEARKWVLPSGLTVYYQQDPRLPTVAIEVEVRAGGALDPREKAGLSAATLDLLKTGTTTRDEEWLATTFADLGATLAVERGADAVELSTSLLGRDLERGLELVADVLRRPAFAADKVDRVRRALLAEKASAAGKPEELLVEAFYRTAFAGTPYEMPLNGTPETLAGLGAEDVRMFHVEHYRPQTTALAIVGSVAPARVRAAVERAFGDWTAPPPRTRPAAAASALATSRRLVVVDKPDQTQVHLRLGFPAIARRDPDWDALAVANYVLGAAGLASRITDVVRTRNGLAYSAGSVLIARVETGPFATVAQTKTATAGRAAELMLAEVERVRREPVPEDELARAKAQVAGALPFRLETNAQKASVLLEAHLHDLGPDHLRRQIERISKLTAEEVRAAAARRLELERLVLAAVGPEAEVRRQLGPLVEAMSGEPKE